MKEALKFLEYRPPQHSLQSQKKRSTFVLLLCLAEDGTLYLAELPDPETVPEKDKLPENTVRVISACGDSLLAAFTGDGKMTVLDRQSGEILHMKDYRVEEGQVRSTACGLGCMLHGTSTLDAVAWRAWLAGERGLLAVADDAMRGEIYPGIYVLDDEGAHRTFATESVCKADACVALMQDAMDAAAAGRKNE